MPKREFQGVMKLTGMKEIAEPRSKIVGTNTGIISWKFTEGINSIKHREETKFVRQNH